jgi:hypothetical protein
MMLLPSSTALFRWPNLNQARGFTWCCMFGSSGSPSKGFDHLEQLPDRDLVLVR